MKLVTHHLQASDSQKRQIINWRENDLGDSLFYSCRSTAYDRTNYPSSLHFHEYYELVFFVQGDIRYICESNVYFPKPGDILLIPPGKFHMSMLNGDATLYRRHVFYLYPDAFDSYGCGALAGFLNYAKDGLWFVSPEAHISEQMHSLLLQLDSALLPQQPLEQALAQSCLLRLFYLLNRLPSQTPPPQQYIPEKVRLIQQYLDDHFSDIQSVEQVAAHFFYSREYLSRLFKSYFNTTVTDYLRKRRIVKSQALIRDGLPLGEICHMVGFDNLSTFIRTFRMITGMTPSQYRSSVIDRQ